MNDFEIFTGPWADNAEYRRAQLRMDLIKAASSNSSCDHPDAAIEYADAVLARLEKEGEVTPAQQEAYEKAQIMLAFARGEKLEADYSNHPTGWEACDDPCWDWAVYDYRIAPAPKPRTSCNQPASETAGGLCPKAPHDHPQGGYLHSEDDDSPFDVDGVLYCGRCHFPYPCRRHATIPADPTVREE